MPASPPTTTSQTLSLDSADIGDAMDLLTRFGEHAVVEAAIRAADSRDRGNIVLFCRWRQVGRFLSAIDAAEVPATLH